MQFNYFTLILPEKSKCTGDEFFQQAPKNITNLYGTKMVGTKGVWYFITVPEKGMILPVQYERQSKIERFNRIKLQQVCLYFSKHEIPIGSCQIITLTCLQLVVCLPEPKLVLLLSLKKLVVHISSFGLSIMRQKFLNVIFPICLVFGVPPNKKRWRTTEIANQNLHIKGAELV